MFARAEGRKEVTPIFNHIPVRDCMHVYSLSFRTSFEELLQSEPSYKVPTSDSKLCSLALLCLSLQQQNLSKPLLIHEADKEISQQRLFRFLFLQFEKTLQKFSDAKN